MIFRTVSDLEQASKNRLTILKNLKFWMETLRNTFKTVFGFGEEKDNFTEAHLGRAFTRGGGSLGPQYRGPVNMENIKKITNNFRERFVCFVLFRQS